MIARAPEIGSGIGDVDAELLARDLVARILGEEDLPDERALWEDLTASILLAMASHRGVTWSPPAGPTPTATRGRVQALVEELPHEALEDPHLLGWVHECLGAEDRRDAFDDHIQRGRRHRAATLTTRLYTPRWVAEFLARESLKVAQRHHGLAEIRVIDPAVGGGQMLLAALRELRRLRPGAAPAELLSGLYGVDLDQRAVEITRWSLGLEVARLFGARCPESEALLEAQILPGDGLKDHFDRPFAVALSNPPYMGWRSMSEELRQELKPRFVPYHSDLFAAFILRCHQLVETGAVGVLAQQSIWYLRRFEAARHDLYSRGDLCGFLHLGARLFAELSGEKASVVAFVQEVGSSRSEETLTPIWDLRAPRSASAKEAIFLDTAPRHVAVRSFGGVPGAPFCHDLPEALRDLFEKWPPLDEFAELPPQNKTSDNKRFVRPWGEVPEEELRVVEELGGRGVESGRWVFYSKGGKFAPWWGGWRHVVDWSDGAREHYASHKTANLLNETFWFRAGLVYTDFGGKRFGARWMPPGCVFDMTGPAIFARREAWPEVGEEEKLGFLLALLNSSVSRRLLSALNPTLHFQVRDVRAVPVPDVEPREIEEIAAAALAIVAGVRALHQGVPGDPLFEPLEAAKESTSFLAELVDQEADLDRRIASLYGVEGEPLEGATVAHHHSLARRSAREK